MVKGIFIQAFNQIIFCLGQKIKKLFVYPTALNFNK